MIQKGAERGRTDSMKMERVWAMPNKWTFQISPIRDLLFEEMGDSKPWIDPFAGMYSPAHIRNDINPEMNAEYHLDALEFLKTLDDSMAAGVQFDPPYSPRQHKKQYGMIEKGEPMFNTDYFSKCKKEIARIVQTRGKVICCWWNSGGIGKSLGFQLDRILLVCHGGTHNDTIITVETKMQESLTT
jgi:hypothetical protein